MFDDFLLDCWVEGVGYVVVRCVGVGYYVEVEGF